MWGCICITHSACQTPSRAAHLRPRANGGGLVLVVVAGGAGVVQVGALGVVPGHQQAHAIGALPGADGAHLEAHGGRREEGGALVGCARYGLALQLVLHPGIMLLVC
jgi:hypothetical protein